MCLSLWVYIRVCGLVDTVNLDYNVAMMLISTCLAILSWIARKNSLTILWLVM